MGTVVSFGLFQCFNRESSIRTCCCGNDSLSGRHNGQPVKRGIFDGNQVFRNPQAAGVIDFIEGKWYGIGRIPNWFEDGRYVDSATNVEASKDYFDTAEYWFDADTNTLRLTNRLFHWASPTQPLSEIKGYLYGAGPYDYHVAFDGCCIPTGDYVIYFGLLNESKTNIKYLIVGDHSGTTGWILSRTPVIPPIDWRLLEREANLTGLNFDRFVLPNISVSEYDMMSMDSDV